MAGYRFFLDTSAPAGRLLSQARRSWVRILEELFAAVAVVGLIGFFIFCNNRKFRQLPTWPAVRLRSTDFRTGDMVIAFNSGLTKPTNNDFFLNPGHVYMAVESGRYGQKLLWDLTFWANPTTFKPLQPTLQKLLAKDVPMFAIHFQGDHVELTRRFRGIIGKLTQNLYYDPDALMAHLAGCMEGLALLPCFHKPLFDVPMSNRYCSVFVLYILVCCGVLRPQVLLDIPRLNPATAKVYQQGGALFYPYLMLHKNMDLGRYCTEGWTSSAPEALAM